MVMERRPAVVVEEERGGLEKQVKDAVEAAVSDSDKVVVQAARGGGATNEANVTVVIQELHVHQ